MTSATVAAAALPNRPVLAAISDPVMVMPPMTQVVGRVGVSRAFKTTEGRTWAKWRAHLREGGETKHDHIPRWVNFRRWYFDMLLGGDAHLEPKTDSDRDVLKVVYRMVEELLAHRPDVPWRESVKADLLKMRALGQSRGLGPVLVRACDLPVAVPELDPREARRRDDEVEQMRLFEILSARARRPPL